MIRLFEPVVGIDRKGFLYVFKLGHLGYMSEVARLISRFGDGYFYLLITLAIYYLDRENGSAFLTSASVAFLIELPLYIVLKNCIRRPRPSPSIRNFLSRHNASDEFSFPSGHTAAAFLYATVLSFYYPQLFLIFYLIAALIGLSRVLLGVHFPSDIAAGILLGCSSALMVL